MPRIVPDFERCVFFLFGKHPQQTNNPIGPGGTGFFVSQHSQDAPLTWHIYGVSNQHAIKEFSSIRVNIAGDKVEYWDLEPTDWEWSKTDDLAVIDVTDRFNFSEETGYYGTELRWIDESNFVFDWFINGYNVGIGDQTVMLGLFADHIGGKVNIPVGRFGNVAATPNANIPISLGPTDTLARPAWLNDTHSRDGFSGSPVWVWRSKYDDLSAFRELSQSFWPEAPRQSFLGLLGCHRGQFLEQVRVWATEDKGGLEKRAVLRSGDDVEIASSMTVVVPAWEISKLLDSERLTAQRSERDKRPDRLRYSEAAQKTIRAQEGRGAPFIPPRY
jgi:hypothetical protein